MKSKQAILKEINSLVAEFSSHALTFEHARHDITYHELKRLMTEYINSPVYNNQQFSGGYIPREKLEMPDLMDNRLTGMVFYYCYNSMEDRVFLAYTTVNNFSYTLPDYFDNSFAPDDLFQVSNKLNDSIVIPNPISIGELDNHLKNNTYSIEAAQPPISFREVLAFNQHFKDRFDTCKNDFSTIEVKCNSKPFGFILEQEINPFLGQSNAVKGVRFYFGFDGSESNNVIRAIFVASFIDASSGRCKNLITLPVNGTATGYAKFLERHFP